MQHDQWTTRKSFHCAHNYTMTFETENQEWAGFGKQID